MQTLFNDIKKLRVRAHTFLAMVLLFFCAFSSLAQTTYQSSGAGSGNWSDALSWSPNGVPVTGDNVTVLNGHNITVDISSDVGTIEINNGGMLTVSNQLTVDASMTVDAGGNLLLITADPAITGSGSFTLSNGANLTVTTSTNGISASGTSGSVQVTGTRTYSSGANYTYNGSANQSMGDGLTEANSITIANSGNTVSASANLQVNGTLTVSNGTFNANGQTVTVAGALSIFGTYATSTQTQTFKGTVNIQPGGTFDNSGNANLIFQNGIFNNGTFTAGNAIYTFKTNSQSLFGNFSAPQVTVKVDGVTLTNNNSLSVNGLTDGTAAGTLVQSSNASLTITGTSTISSIDATANGNTVTYGAANQQISASVSNTYYNLTINQAATATINGNLTVNGLLTFSNGNIALGSSNLTIGSLGSISSSPNWIITTSGLLNKTFSSLTSFTFPIGDASTYSPVDVNVTTGTFSSSFTIGTAVANAKHSSNASPIDYLNRYWSITPSGITNGKATVTGQYVVGDVSGTESSINAAELTGTFNKTTNPWTAFSSLSSNTLTATNAKLTDGQTSYFTGIQNALVADAGTVQSVCASGGTATLGGAPTASGGAGVYSYSWSPTTNLNDATIANPTFTASTTAGTTAYTVTVTDANGITATSQVNVTVVAYPVISQNPIAVIQCDGGSANFNVAATGTTLSYQWQENQGSGFNDLSDVGVYTGSNGSTLAISNVTGKGGYQYRVIVKETTAPGCALAATASVSLTVNPLPTLSSAIQSATICAGSSTSINLTGLVPSTTSSIDYSINGVAQTPITNVVADASGKGSFATRTLTALDDTQTLQITGITITNATPNCSASFTNSLTLAVDSLAKIVTQPTATQTLCVGSPLNLSVTATGTGLSYQWNKNGAVISGATSSSFSIATVATTDAGNYTVKVTSSGVCTPKTVTSSIAQVVINRPATITAQPTAAQTLCVGSPLNLSVTATGTGLSYQWYRDATPVGANSNSFNIASVATTNAGNYTVVVTSSGVCVPAAVTSNVAQVTINTTAAITTQPTAAQTLCVGSPLNLSVTATGTNLNYQWKKDGVALSGETNAAFSITSVVTTDAGNYTVDVKNGGVCAPIIAISNVAQVAINTLATITTQPIATQTLCAGSSFNLTVAATGTGLSYQWYHGATPVGTNSNSFNIANVASTDAGNYTVDVKSSGVCVPTTVTSSPVSSLTVQDLPIGSLVGTTSICAGANTNLTFTLTGTGNYDVDYTDGASTFTLSGITSPYTLNVSPSSTTTYKITRVKDNGTIGCLATNLGTSVTVTVNPIPAVVTHAAEICSPATIDLTAAGITSGSTSGLTFTYWTDASATSSLTNPNAVSISGTYYIKGTAATTCYSIQPVNVTITPLVTVNVGMDTVVCQSTSVHNFVFGNRASVSNGNGVYSWSASPSGAGVGAFVNNTVLNPVFAIAANYSGTITFKLTANGNGSCLAQSNSFDLVVTPAVVADAGSNDEICQSTSVINYDFSTRGTVATSSNYSGLTWTASGGGTFVDASLLNPVFNITANYSGTITFTLTATANGSCSIVIDTFTLKVDQQPNANAGVDGNSCGLTFTFNATPSVGTGTWTQFSGPGTSSFDDAHNFKATATVSQYGTYVFQWTEVNGGASCTDSKQITVNFYKQPDLSLNNTTFTVCDGQAPTIALSNPNAVSGTGYVWTVSSSNINGAANQSTPVVAADINTALSLSPDSNSQGNVLYTVQSVANGCYSAPQSLEVNVNPKPVSSSLTQTVCSDVVLGNVVTLTTNPSSVSAASYIVNSITFNPTTSTLTPSAGGPSVGSNKPASELIDDAWTNTTGADVDVIYNITPVSSAGCNGSSFTVTATIQSEPIGTNATASTCSDVASGYDLGGSGTTSYNISINSNGLVQSSGTVSSGTSKTATELADDAWTNTTTVDVDVVYTVTPVNAQGCLGDAFIVTLTVHPELVGIAQTFSRCSSELVNVTIGTTVGSASPSGFNISTNANGLTQNGGTVSAGSNMSSTELQDDQWLNTGSVPVNVIYTITPVSSIGSCLGDSFTITVTINPAPVVSTLLDRIICSDGTSGITLANDGSSVSAASYTINNITPDVLYNSIWIQGTGNANAVSGMPASAILNDTYTNEDNINHTVTYNVTAISSANCASASQDIVLTVKPKPVLSGSLSTSTCSDAISNITLSTNSTSIAADSYTINSITIQSGLIAASLNATIGSGQTDAAIQNDKFTNQTNAPLTVTYNITPVTNGCVGDALNVVLTVNPEPVLSTALNNTVCGEQASGITLNTNGTSVTADSYTINITPSIPFNSATWIAAATNAVAGSTTSTNYITNDSYTNLTSAPLTVTYNITPFNGSCTGKPYDVVLTVKPLPTIAASDKTICSGTSTNIAITNPNNVSATAFNWIIKDSTNVKGAIVGSGSVINQVLTAVDGVNNGSVTYTITPVANGCTGSSQDVTVTVTPVPVITNTAVQLLNTICSGTALNFTPTNTITGTTYTWTSTVSGTVIPVNPSGSGAITDAPVNTGTASGTVTYFIVPSYNGCNGAGVNYVVTVRPQPQFTFANNAPTICSGSQTSIKLNTLVTNGRIRLQSVVYGSVIGTLTTGALYNDGQSITETLINNTNAPITVKYVFEAIVGSCGPSASQEVDVVVNPNPTFAINNSTPEICSGSTPSISLTSPTQNATMALQNVSYGLLTGGAYTSGGSFTDGQSLLEGALIDSASSPITVTYTFTITAASCPLTTVTQSTTVKINPAPVFSLNNTTPQICTGSQTNVALTTSVANSQIKLKSVAYGAVVGTLSAGVLYNNGQSITETLINNTNAPVTVTYTFESIVGTCGPSPTQQTTVTVNPSATFSITNTTAAICSGSAPSISLASPTQGATMTLQSVNYGALTGGGAYASGGSFTDGQSLSESTLVNDTNVPITVNYTFTVSANGCNNPTAQSTTVVVNPNPLFTITNNAPSICSGTSTDIAITSPTANAVVTLTSVDYSATIGGTQANNNTFAAGQSIKETLKNSSNTQDVVTYTFSMAANGCGNSTTQSASVIVKAIPKITNTATQLQTTICSATALNFTPTSIIGTTAYTWKSKVNGTISSVSSSGNGAIVDIPVNTGNTVGTVTYTITPGYNSCNGDSVHYVVTVNPIPDVAANDQVICSNTSTNILITNPNNVSGTSFSWIIQDSTNVKGAVVGSGSSINQVLTSGDKVNVGNVVYTITPTANGCSGSTLDVTATANPVPVIINTTDQLQNVICSATALNFTPTNTISTTTYSWTSTVIGMFNGITSSGNGTINDTPQNTLNAAGTIIYHIKPTVGSCNGLVKDYIVTVQPVPSVNGSDLTICTGSPAIVTLDASPKNVTGTTFAWVAAPSANATGASDGDGSKISQNLSLSDTANVGTVIYHVTPTANSCQGNVKDITVTINPLAKVYLMKDFAICQSGETPFVPSTISLSGAIGGAATTATWQVITGSGTISSSTINGTSVTAIYTVSQTDVDATSIFKLITDDPDLSGPCAAVSGLLNVRVNRSATVKLRPDSVVCEPSTISLKGTIGGDATTGAWSVGSIYNGTLSATSISGKSAMASYAVNPIDIDSTITYVLTAYDPDGSGPCTSVSDSVDFTFNRAARVFAPASLAMCSNQDTISLHGNYGGSTTDVTWTGGLGTFSNVSDSNAVYTKNNSFEKPAVNGTPIIVHLTLTAHDPDGSGPCAAVSTQTQLTINSLPLVVFSGFSKTAYVQNDSVVTLIGNQTGGTFTIKPDSANIGSTTYNPLAQVKFDPSHGHATLGRDTIIYTYTDVSTHCTNSISQSVLINPITSVRFSIKETVSSPEDINNNIYRICADQINTAGYPSPSYVLLVGKPPANGNAQTRFVSDSGTYNHLNKMNIIHSGNEYYIETAGLAADTYTVTYWYENEYGAITKWVNTVIVNSAAAINMQVSSHCNQDSITFSDTGTPVTEWKWTFGDNSPTSVDAAPKHVYINPGIYSVTLQVTTATGCLSSTTQAVNIGSLPLTNFSVSSICTNDSTKFADKTSHLSTDYSRIVEYKWVFGDGITLVGDSTSTAWNAGNKAVGSSNRTGGSYKNPLHKYATYGTYEVIETVATDNGCAKSYSQNIFILPYESIAPSSSQPYLVDFESDTTWQPQSLIHPLSDSSYTWMQTVADGTVINDNSTSSKSWWTGRNNKTYLDTLESSVVNGPCFNLSSLERPMIALDYWVNTPNNDGGAVQYSVNGGIDWVNIGVPADATYVKGHGINWYSGTPVISNPGNQPKSNAPYGWAGDTQTKWMRASFNLDSIPKTKRNQVRIRMAFAGDASRNYKIYNGFAFDNVYVGEKTKTVLVEHFTNEPSSNNRAADVYFDGLYNNQINFRNQLPQHDTSDFYVLEYHVRFPQPDDFEQTNNAASARALYYGVQQTPYSLMDGIQSGIYQSGDYNNIDVYAIDSRALRSPQVTIVSIDTTSQTRKYSNHTLSVSLKIKADTIINSPLTAQVALVEDSIYSHTYSSTDTVYRHIVDQLLLGSTGITKTLQLQAGDTCTFSNYDVNIDAEIKNPNNLRLVAFVQNFVTKEILQTAIMHVNRKGTAVVTGIEKPTANLESVQLYPNPAVGKFNLSLSGGFEQGSVWKIYNQNGVQVMNGDFADATNSGVKTIDVSSLPNAVYIVAIASPATKPVYKKLVVVNGN